MSDSDTADTPSDATISRTLRDVVIAIHKTGVTDDLTVKRVRARAEQELNLPTGFLKTHPEWKQKSNDAIREAVETYCRDDPASEAHANSSPAKASKPAPAPKKRTTATEESRGVKRGAAAPAKKPRKPQKRRKTTISSDEESDAHIQSDPPNDPPKQPARRSKKVIDSDDEEDDTPNGAGLKTAAKAKDEEGEDEGPQVGPLKEEDPAPQAALDIKGDVSESELSSLIDEEPVKKKRQKRAPAEKNIKGAKGKAKAKPSKSKASQDDDPDSAEIKRLQGWLVKCGIRKVWSKELAKCDTAKDKIKHLKGMLKDAGMEGKYSNEKAARIKEQREFAKDLEAIQEGERAWGKTDEIEAGGRPRRRLNRGSRPVVKADSDDDDDDDVDGGKESDEADSAKDSGDDAGNEDEDSD